MPSEYTHTFAQNLQIIRGGSNNGETVRLAIAEGMEQCGDAFDTKIGSARTEVVNMVTTAQTLIGNTVSSYVSAMDQSASNGATAMANMVTTAQTNMANAAATARSQMETAATVTMQNMNNACDAAKQYLDGEIARIEDEVDDRNLYMTVTPIEGTSDDYVLEITNPEAIGL